MTNDATSRQDRGRPEIGRRSVLQGIALGGTVAGLGAPTLRHASPRRDSGSGRIREYWIQAESFRHNLVPTGRDDMTGERHPPDGTTYWALGYRARTPGWRRPLPGDPAIGANDGIPGPVIRAQVGDTVRVHFRNADTHYRFPHSMHVHGLTYDPESDGAHVAVEPHKPGTAVAVGESYTYTWRALPSSVGTWVYHDHSAPQSLRPAKPPVAEIGAQLGLFGLVVVTDRDTAPVDREFCLFFHDLYADDVPGLADDLDCFNGRAFLGNTPTFTAKVGERVRWRIGSLGKEFHVFHLHGHRWRAADGFTDAQVIGPATTLTVEYVEDNPGDWLYHCHVTDHMMGGMVGRYRVQG